MKVMVAMDESEGSFYALNWVLSKVIPPPPAAPSPTPATAVDGGGQTVDVDDHGDESSSTNMVYLLHVNIPFQTYVYPAGPGPVVCVASSVFESVRQAQAKISASIFARASRACQEKGIRSSTIGLLGDPKDMICRTAEERHVDVLVVGSRGLGMIKRTFLGSVSDYCAHHAQCAVLIVKPPKEVTDNEREAHTPKTE